MKNKIGLIIAIAALCVSVACVIVCCVVLSGNTKPAKGDEDLQYVLYLGTNDKDTNKPVYAPEDAKEVLKDILISHMGGVSADHYIGGNVFRYDRPCRNDRIFTYCHARADDCACTDSCILFDGHFPEMVEIHPVIQVVVNRQYLNVRADQNAVLKLNPAR